MTVLNSYELFTVSKSSANLRLYQRLGYREIRRQAVAPHLELVFLRKTALHASMQSPLNPNP